MGEKLDNVNHPKHYEDSTSFECIETMLIAFGIEYTQVFCVLNAYKYMWRYENKNGLEDLEKTQWYLDKYFSLVSEYEEDPLPEKAMLLQFLLNDKRSKINGVD